MGFVLNDIGFHVHGIRGIDDVACSKTEVASRNVTKQLLNNYSFAQTMEENIKKHASTKVKDANDEKSLAKIMRGMVLRKFSKWLNEKHIKTILNSKRTRRGELTNRK